MREKISISIILAYFLFSTICISIIFSLNMNNLLPEKSLIPSKKFLVEIPINTLEHRPLWTYDVGYDIQTLAISADGNFIAAGDSLHSLYLFNKSGGLIWTYTIGAGYSIDTIAISSDGQYIVAGYYHGTYGRILLFNNTSNVPMWIYGPMTNSLINEIAISDNGMYIAAATSDGIYLLNRTDGFMWKYFNAQSYKAVDISDDGMYIITGSSNLYNIYLFNKTNPSPMWSYGASDGINSVAISENGMYFAAVTGAWPLYNNELFYFNRTYSSPILNPSATVPIVDVKLSDDGQYILTLVAGHTYMHLNTSSMPFWGFNTSDTIISADFSADGMYVVAGNTDNRVYLLNRTITLPSVAVPMWNHSTNGDVDVVAISDDGNNVTVGSADNNVYYFHITEQGSLPPESEPTPPSDLTPLLALGFQQPRIISLIIPIAIITVIGVVVVIVVVIIKKRK